VSLYTLQEPHNNHEVITMVYSWEDKCTFVEIKLMAVNILCKTLNDELYTKDMLIEDLKKLIRRLDAEEPRL
jgi:uncharacterized protein YqfB (UPF0267 family)